MINKVFNKPINTLLTSILFGIILFFTIKVFFGFIINPLIIAFCFYLLASFSYNLFLVLNKKLTWRTYLLVPAILIITLIFISISNPLDPSSTWTSLFLNMSIGGIMIFLIELYIQKQNDKVKVLITKKLSNHILEIKKIYPHPLSPWKFSFKDFSAVITKVTYIIGNKGMTTLGTIETIAAPREKKLGVGLSSLLGYSAIKSTENQFGKGNLYTVDIFMANPGYPEFKIGDPKSFYTEFIDKSIIDKLPSIDEQVTKKVVTVYFADFSIATGYPKGVLRISIENKFFEENTEKVYIFLCNLKNHFETK